MFDKNIEKYQLVLDGVDLKLEKLHDAYLDKYGNYIGLLNHSSDFKRYKNVCDHLDMVKHMSDFLECMRTGSLNGQEIANIRLDLD